MPHIYLRQDTSSGLGALFPDGLPCHWMQVVKVPFGKERLGFPIDLDNLNPIQLRDLLSYLQSVCPNYLETENLESKGIAIDFSDVTSCEYSAKEIAQVREAWNALTEKQQILIFPLICGGLQTVTTHGANP